MVRARFVLNRSGYVRIVGPMMNQAAYRAAQSIRSKAVGNIRSLGRVNTGAMKDSIRVRKATTKVPESTAYTIGSTVPYAKYQEFGTRAHGPVRARYLVFRIRGRGPLIRTKWVRGVTPGRFMRDAMKATTIRDFYP
jgi:hypothetical protein